MNSKPYAWCKSNALFTTLINLDKGVTECLVQLQGFSKLQVLLQISFTFHIQLFKIPQIRLWDTFIPNCFGIGFYIPSFLLYNLYHC